MCLNPYYAGIWSRSFGSTNGTQDDSRVLILIMLEYGLGVHLGSTLSSFLIVLILIMLEYGLGDC